MRSASGVRNRGGMRFSVLLCAMSLLGAFHILRPAVVPAQDATSVSGFGKGERDTMRVESRMEGREERVVDARVSDQKIGYEERRIRLERRAEELLRAEERVRQRQERFVMDEEKERAEARKREAEDLRRQKRAVEILPDF